jgi:hypothetical protein
MHEIGRVKLLQVQRASLKAGAKPHKYYDPAPLLAVERLLLTPAGCVGLVPLGEPVVDVHHAQHPLSKSRQGSNGISIGFSDHYRAMRDRFGAHLTDGIAGENVLVEADGSFELAELGGAVVIECAGGVAVRLAELMVADPCVEFSRFANLTGEPLTPDELRATLQFLGDGRRGFYARLADGAPEVVVRVGDRVLLETSTD